MLGIAPKGATDALDCFAHRVADVAADTIWAVKPTDLWDSKDTFDGRFSARGKSVGGKLIEILDIVAEGGGDACDTAAGLGVNISYAHTRVLDTSIGRVRAMRVTVWVGWLVGQVFGWKVQKECAVKMERTSLPI